MVAFERGFRRLAWVVTALCVPLVALLTYEGSGHAVGYEPRPVRNLVNGYAPVLQKPVHIQGSGIVWVPTEMSDSDIDMYVKRFFTKAANPTAFEVPRGRYLIEDLAHRVREKFPDKYIGNDVQVVTKVVAEYPEYRDWLAVHEYELSPRIEKRPIWTTGVTLGVIALLAVFLQGSISLVAWVFRGFKGSG